MQLNDIVLVDAALNVTHNPVRSLQGGVTVQSISVEGGQQRPYARYPADKTISIKQWVLQSNAANIEKVLAQIYELSKNPYAQPVYVQFKDGVVTAEDGWYIIEDFKADFDTVFTGSNKVDFSLRKVAPRSRNRVIRCRDASLTVSLANSTALGLPPDAVTMPNEVTRTGAEGSYRVAPGFSSGNIQAQVASNTPNFTQRCRVYDRSTGAAESTLLGTGTLAGTGWQEIYGVDHSFTSDCILTNGLVMVSFVTGLTPTVYRYLNGVWVWAEQITWNSGGGTNQTVQAFAPLRIHSESSQVKVQTAAAGSQAELTFRLDRGMLFVDVVGFSFTSGGQLVYVPSKVPKIGISDGGITDVAKGDTPPAEITAAYTSIVSADAGQTWIPTISQTILSGPASLSNTTLLLPLVGSGVSQRASFSAAYQAGGDAFLQKEAEAATLLGTASIVADAAASAGSTVQCPATNDGVSFVPGTDGQGVPTGMNYGIAVRARTTGPTDTQQVSITTPAGAKTLSVTGSAYTSAVYPAPAVAATGQLVTVKRATLTYPNLILNDGPWRYYKLNDTTATAIDSAASPSNGNYNGGYTQSQAGIPGDLADNSTLFNGTTGYVVEGDPQPGSGNIDHTLECWIYPTSTSASHIFGWGQTSTTRGSTFLILRANAQLAWETYNDDSVALASMSLNAWHHVAVSYTAATNTGRVYLDGVLGTTKVLGGALALASSGYGRIADANLGGTNESSFYTGRVAHAASYKTALTAQQIAAHYNVGNGSGTSTLYLDEIGILPLGFNGNGPLDQFNQWASDKSINYPVFPN